MRKTAKKRTCTQASGIGAWGHIYAAGDAFCVPDRTQGQAVAMLKVGCVVAAERSDEYTSEAFAGRTGNLHHV